LVAQNVPSSIPRRSSIQLLDGFGVNIILPRQPRMPWSKTWAPIFDSGVKWVRIGQYENSSEQVNWDWVEQTPGHYVVPNGADEAIRSLLDNGVSIEVELQYSNALYSEDKSKRPAHVTPPPPGIGQNQVPTNPIYFAPRTDEQIEAFLGYVRFMVERYKGRINHWELWNEEDGGYWRPDIAAEEKAKWYGRVFCRYADAVHTANPGAKVIFGGLGSPNISFVKHALAGCAEKLDIMAYHSYPGGPFGVGRPPEEIDSLHGGVQFRQGVVSMPGIHAGLEFWLNEWGINATAKGSNQTVQARYLPRFYLEQRAHDIRGFVWEFMSATDGNEENRMGIVEGDTLDSSAFRPREAFHAFENLSAVFGQTVRDRGGEEALQPIKEYNSGQLRAYWFHDRVSGRRVFAYWLAIPADPNDVSKPISTTLTITDPKITRPILMDIRTGKIQELHWIDREKHTLSVPVKDSVMAVADATYVDWTEVPETPREFIAKRSGTGTSLLWKASPGAVTYEIQRSCNFGPWIEMSQVTAPVSDFTERTPAPGQATYRVRARNANGCSPWSNPTWVGQDEPSKN
jgi:hypothetical protein